MKRFEFGNPKGESVLIQPVDEHDLEGIEREYSELFRLAKREFRLLALETESWNRDLSPWKAPAVFRGEPFAGGAGETLREVLSLCTDKTKRYYLGGYSLAGLFALWAVCETPTFSGIAAASPSVWFPDFMPYLRAHRVKTETVYLSLGDREKNTRNPQMATVADCIAESERILSEQGVNVVLEWNEGNHFKDADIRTARAFAWVLNAENRETPIPKNGN